MQVKYVDVGKDTYLLEVSENLRGSVPQHYELQSTKKVMKRCFPVLVPSLSACPFFLFIYFL